MTREYEPIEKLPPITDAMLEAMREVFPLRPLTPSSTERDDVYHAGQQSVIDFLRKAQLDQQDRKDE